VLLPTLRRCLLVPAALFAALPAASAPQESASAPRLLTPREGRAIVLAAWGHREQIRRRPDCSHLVHEVYEFAGFPYPYASSFDLYDGTDSFRRVTTPRAGDLIVWPGHVGIVVDPVGRTFYSSVQSGLRIESYDGSYWRAHGRPRFFRYVRNTGGTLLTAKDSPRTSPSEPRPRLDARPRSVAPPARGEDSAALPDKPAPEDSEEIAAVPASSLARPLSIPSSILVVSAAARPTKDEVSDAVSELASAHGNLLRAGPPLDPARPVSVYDQLAVEHLEFKRDHAWARVRFATRLAIVGERFDNKRRNENLRLELRRAGQGWQLLAPAGRAYVPRDVAIHVLASQLALLTQDNTAPTNGAPRDPEPLAKRPVASDPPVDAAQRRKYLIVRALASLVDPE
jgi:hypothetical protein